MTRFVYSDNECNKIMTGPGSYFWAENVSECLDRDVNKVIAVASGISTKCSYKIWVFLVRLCTNSRIIRLKPGKLEKARGGGKVCFENLPSTKNKRTTDLLLSFVVKPQQSRNRRINNGLCNVNGKWLRDTC